MLPTLQFMLDKYRPQCRPQLASLIAVVIAFIIRLVWQRLHRRKTTQRHLEEKGNAGPSLWLNAEFFRRFWPLVKICIPSVTGVESLMVVTMITLLALRTKLTLFMARTVGKNAKALVDRDVRGVVYGVADLVMWALPATVTNVGIRYMTSSMEFRFRENLQKYLHAKYLTGDSVYKVAVNGLIENPDHRLTQDVHLFCAELTDILPSVIKPVFDILMFIRALSEKGGIAPPAILVAYYASAAMALRAFHPDFARLITRSQEKEGDLRAMHAQVVRHAEEVAFYRGEAVERDNAARLLRRVITHEALIKRLKWWMSVVDTVLLKHGAIAVGYSVCAIVVYGQATSESSVSELAELYTQSSQLYIPLSRAIGKLLGLSKKVGAVVGCTYRVGNLRNAIEALSSPLCTDENGGTCSKGTLIEESNGDKLAFKHVNVSTPEGHCLLEDFTLTIPKNQHTLIMGSNGSGKSSLIRTVASLWSHSKGEIVRPPLSSLVFLPQRVYLPGGPLRDLFTYPHSKAEMALRGVDDEELLQCADEVGLLSVITREGGLDVEKSWNDVLSGGERQRVSLVRVLCHRPTFAFLDECTSAVSQDAEPQLYTNLQKRGVTLVTVSYRDTLVSLHRSLVTLDGSAKYHISPICSA